MNLLHQAFLVLAVHKALGTIGVEFSKESGTLRGNLDLGLMQAIMMSSNISVVSAIVERELTECSLAIVFDESSSIEAHLVPLLTLPNLKQVIKIQDVKDFHSMIWTSSTCHAYIFFFENPEPLLVFVNEEKKLWDYQGKYVLVGLKTVELETVAASMKGKKTEHIVGITKEGRNTWRVCTNRFYWGDGLQTVNWWKDGELTSNRPIFLDKGLDLQGRVLKLVTFELEPFVIYDEDGGGPVRGTDIEITKTLSEVLNFTIEVIEPPPDELWGLRLENGSWNGMAGYMERDEADIGACCLYLVDYDNYLDITSPSRFYGNDRTCFMIMAESPLPLWQSLVRPYQGTTWLVLLVFFVALCSVFHWILKKSTSVVMDFNKPFDLSSTVLYGLGIHLRMPQLYLPAQTSAQVLVAFLWLYTIIVTTGYSCNLTALLTTHKVPKGIETLRELYESQKKVFAYADYFEDSLQSATNLYLKNLTKRFELVPGGGDIRSDLLEGKGVLMESKAILEHIITNQYTQKGIPSMRLMKECYAEHSIIIEFQKNSPLKKNSDRIIERLYEAGLIGKWFLDSLKGTAEVSGGDDEKEDRTQGAGSEGIPLGIVHLQGIFFILAGGCALAIPLFIFEFVYSKE